MRKHGKVDGNHTAIVERFRALGYSVQSLASIGNGCPDLLVARAGKMALVEIKTPRARVNAGQLRWMMTWNSDAVYVVRSVDDVDAFETIAERGRPLQRKG